MSTILTGSHAILDWAVASRPLAGERVSGDLHLVQPHANGVLVAVVDGLGHGEEAAVAASVAVAALMECADQSVLAALRHCHERLKPTRGVVMSLAAFDAENATMTWSGVGNVEGILIRAEAGVPHESILLRGGVIGYQLPPLQASLVSVHPGDTLIFVTDGVSDAFRTQVVAGQTPLQLATSILNRFGKTTDDALVLVARLQEGRT